MLFLLFSSCVYACVYVFCLVAHVCCLCFVLHFFLMLHLVFCNSTTTLVVDRIVTKSSNVRACGHGLENDDLLIDITPSHNHCKGAPSMTQLQPMPKLCLDLKAQNCGSLVC
jgi:hypothetical protein